MRWMLLLGFLLLMSGCDGMNAEGDGMYRYTAFDEAGAVLVRGTLRLDFVEADEAEFPVRITGSWDLEQVRDEATVGPQVGEGRLQGSVDAEGTLWISLNPQMADNNVFLSGSFEEERSGDLQGRWMYSTFVGPTSEGPFTATRR